MSRETLNDLMHPYRSEFPASNLAEFPTHERIEAGKNAILKLIKQARTCKDKHLFPKLDAIMDEILKHLKGNVTGQQIYELHHEIISNLALYGTKLEYQKGADELAKIFSS